MKIEIFKNNDFGAVRVLTDEKGDVWFVGRDVAEILGYTNPHKAIKDHIDEDDKRGERIVTPSGTQEVIVINESGLYSLILRSKLEKAKKFKRWVTSEVLPSIRKYGGYLTPKKTEELINNPDLIIELAKALKKEREEKQKLKEKVNLLTHTKKLYTSTEIAKELGFKSAREFNKKLQDIGIQYKVNNTWVLTAKYAELGYESIKQHVLDNGKVIYDRKWTQTGREFLINKLKGALKVALEGGKDA